MQNAYGNFLWSLTSVGLLNDICSEDWLMIVIILFVATSLNKNVNKLVLYTPSFITSCSGSGSITFSGEERTSGCRRELSCGCCCSFIAGKACNIRKTVILLSYMRNTIALTVARPLGDGSGPGSESSVWKYTHLWVQNNGQISRRCEIGAFQ